MVRETNISTFLSSYLIPYRPFPHSLPLFLYLLIFSTVYLPAPFSSPSYSFLPFSLYFLPSINTYLLYSSLSLLLPLFHYPFLLYFLSLPPFLRHFLSLLFLSHLPSSSSLLSRLLFLPSLKLKLNFHPTVSIPINIFLKNDIFLIHILPYIQAFSHTFNWILTCAKYC